MHTIISFFVGLISLGLQFVFNRLIFFYIVNTDYATVSVISLHLIGFLAGALLAARWRQANLVTPVMALPLLIAIFHIISWRYGLELLPIYGILASLLVAAFTVAFLAGFIIAHLMANQSSAAHSTHIVIADTAGSVVGAVMAGFFLLPFLGLNASFFVFTTLAVTLSLFYIKRAPKIWLTHFTLLIVLIFLPFEGIDQERYRVEGYPLIFTKKDNQAILETLQTPLGILSVIGEDSESLILYTDNMPLCHVETELERNRHNSMWAAGAFSGQYISTKKISAPRIAMIGLGCGLTLAASLEILPNNASIDMIEVNSGIPQITRIFSPYVGDVIADPRVHIHIQDGFKYFMRRADNDLYDAITMDIAWMRDANLTHLYSMEFFQKIHENLTPEGIFVVWTEVFDEHDPAAHIIYATLQSTFPHVGVRQVNGSIFYVAAKQHDILLDIPHRDQLLSQRIRMNSAGAPINKLDHLVLNRMLFGQGIGLYSYRMWQE